MKIIQLTAENVKRLNAVSITPDGTVQIITGRNAQGKTSVLDAIWLALGGNAASRKTARPVREGQKQAQVRLDLGEMVVTRTWQGDKTALKVEAADGARYNSPQALLDRLVGRLSFDPLEFTRLSAREQVSTLLDLVNLDVNLDALAAERARAYNTRTDIGREIKTMEGHRDGLGLVEVDAPAEEVSVAVLVGQHSLANERHLRYRSLVDRHEALVARVDALHMQVAQAMAELETVSTEIETEAPLLPDLDALGGQIEGAEQTNRAVRRNKERADVQNQLDDWRNRHAEATATIEQIDQEKADALAKAEFPVPGLGFDDAGVTYNGIPFGQVSSSEQIRVSLAMAMALNPTLRVIRILDGSLLDEDNLELIAGMAALEDYQVWIERVTDGSGVGVVIEDGSVVPPEVTE